VKYLRSFDWRVIIGLALIALGVLALLQIFGVLPELGNLTTWIVAGLFAAGGLAFLTVLARGRQNWWAAIPGIVLLDLAAIIWLGDVLPSFSERFGGGIFLAGISLAFWIVYALTPENWWAVIPGGVLLTLGVVASLGDTGIIETGGVFFLGLALTFALVALLPGGRESRGWAWIPAGILFVIGVLAGVSATQLVGYVWPVALILVGLVLLVGALRR